MVKKTRLDQPNREWWDSYTNFYTRGDDEMKWSDTGGGTDFEPAPAGTHGAICFQLIDLGTNHNAMYDNYRRQIYIGFEIPGEICTWKDDEGEHSAPFTVGKFYTMSLNEKANLRKDMESWRGKAFTDEELEGFDPKNILGAPALVSIVHKLKEGKKTPKANISSISKLMKGMELPPVHHDRVYFSFDDFNQDDFDKVSKGFQSMIKNSEEWKELRDDTLSPAPESENPAPVDDIPF